MYSGTLFDTEKNKEAKTETILEWLCREKEDVRKVKDLNKASKLQIAPCVDQFLDLMAKLIEEFEKEKGENNTFRFSREELLALRFKCHELSDAIRRDEAYSVKDSYMTETAKLIVGKLTELILKIGRRYCVQTEYMPPLVNLAEAKSYRF
jgi:hypothetical protein